MAVYLRRSGFDDARLDNLAAEWDDVCRVYLPDPVSSFVFRFDRGEYPALDVASDGRPGEGRNAAK